MTYNHFENPLQSLDYSVYTSKLHKIHSVELQHILELSPDRQPTTDQFTTAVLEVYTQKISQVLQKISEEQ